MNAEEKLIEKINTLWGRGYNDETGEDIPSSESPWRDMEQRDIEESLFQSDDLTTYPGIEVVFAAIEYMKEKLNGN